MDRRIYRQTDADLGIYSARRLPKGNSSAALMPSGGGVTVDKPNAATIDMTSNLGDVAQSAGVRERKRYLCPKNRRAVIQNASVNMLRKTLGGAGSFCWIGVFITRKGRTDADKEIVVFLDAVFAAAGNSDHGVSSPGNTIDIFEGDQVWIADADNSAGGTIDMVASAALIEFDSTYSYAGSQGDPRMSDAAGVAGGAAAPSGSGFGMASQLFQPTFAAPAPTSFTPPFAIWTGK